MQNNPQYNAQKLQPIIGGVEPQAGHTTLNVNLIVTSLHLLIHIGDIHVHVQTSIVAV